MQRAEGARELLDGPVPAADLAACLRDLDRLNAWFGGYALTLGRLSRLAARVDPSRTLVVVDVGGGRGDFAVRVVRWARRTGRRVRIIVIDHDARMLALAHGVRGAHPEITFVRAEATALPLREAGADAVVSALTLHHLEPPAAAAALAEMGAGARHLVVVNDLLRSRLSLALVWLATRLLAMHAMSRHDGPLSVRRAYSPAELMTLAEKAGFALVVDRHPVWGRLVAEWSS